MDSKKSYTQADAEVVLFDNTDVILTSPDCGKDSSIPVYDWNDQDGGRWS